MTSDMNVQQIAPTSWARLCLVAGRAWSLPASTMSVAFGTVLAVTIGGGRL